MRILFLTGKPRFHFADNQNEEAEGMGMVQELDMLQQFKITDSKIILLIYFHFDHSSFANSS